MKPTPTEQTPAISGTDLKEAAAALQDFAGRIVAVVAGEVRVSGRTWDECARAARATKLTDAEIFYVPLPDATGVR